MEKHITINETITKILPQLTQAISELSSEGINGVIYFYQKGECSCCYGSKNTFFQIAGNTAENWGGYKKGLEPKDFKINFEHDQNKADTLAKVLRKWLRGSGFSLDWDGDTAKCMFIVPKKI